MKKTTPAVTGTKPVPLVIQRLEANMSKLEYLLPAKQNPKQFMAMVMNVLRGNPKLMECTPLSIFSSVAYAATHGFNPAPGYDHVYFVPYKDNKARKIGGVSPVICTPILGYKGMLVKAQRSGRICNVESHVIYEGDDYSFEYGTNSRIQHTPAFKSEDILYVYIVYTIYTPGAGTTKQFEILPFELLDAERKKARTDKFWGKHFIPMSKKHLVRRSAAWLPCEELKLAVANEEAMERGELTAQNLIGGEGLDFMGELEHGVIEAEVEDSTDEPVPMGSK